MGRAARPRAVARRLKARIRADTGLTASAGVAPNKFLAKIASGWKKPDGLTVISPERVEPFLQQLPVDALWGVGPVTARKLRARGIERLVDVRTTEPQAAARGGRQPRRLAAAARAGHRRSAGRAESRSEVVRQREHLRRGPDRSRRAFAARSPRWPPTPPRWLSRSAAAGAHRDHQGPVRRLHDDHPQPHRAAPTRTEADIVGARRPAAREDRGRDAGRSGCWASASTISAEKRRPSRETAACRSRKTEPMSGRRHLESDPIRPLPARARAAVLRPDGARPRLPRHAGRRSRLRHRQADAAAPRASCTRGRRSASTARRGCSNRWARRACRRGCASRSARSRRFSAREEYDLVFSNAALHWVEDHERLIPHARRGAQGRWTARVSGAGLARRRVARWSPRS